MRCLCPSGDAPLWERKAGLTPINPDCLVHGDPLEPMPGSLDPWQFIGRLEHFITVERIITTTDWNRAITAATHAHERTETA